MSHEEKDCRNCGEPVPMTSSASMAAFPDRVSSDAISESSMNSASSECDLDAAYESGRRAGIAEGRAQRDSETFAKSLPRSAEDPLCPAGCGAAIHNYLCEPMQRSAEATPPHRDDAYRAGHAHYTRQHGKKWPLSPGPSYWDEMSEDERMCWRAGFEEYHREVMRMAASNTDRESARIWLARNSIDDLLGDQEDVDEAIEDLAALLGNVRDQRRERATDPLVAHFQEKKLTEAVERLKKRLDTEKAEVARLRKIVAAANLVLADFADGLPLTGPMAGLQFAMNEASSPSSSQGEKP